MEIASVVVVLLLVIDQVARQLELREKEVDHVEYSCLFSDLLRLVYSLVLFTLCMRLRPIMGLTAQSRLGEGDRLDVR